MPDINGRLTPEDQAKIRAHFARHWKGLVVCPVCKSTTWTTADYVVQIRRWAVEEFSAPTYPFVLVICNTCAHTLQFNAVTMGIVANASAEPPVVANAFNPPKVGG